MCWRLSELLEYVDSAGESGEVVATFSVEEAGVGQSPHVLGLDLCPMEPTLDQHPHKERKEICENGV